MSQTFSFVVPTHNRAHILRRALDSLLDQTRPVHEVIVVDDGSTDATATLFTDGAVDPRVRYVLQDRRGAAAARNAGAALATGDYLAFLDSDDVVDRCWVEKFTAAATADPVPAAVFCGFRSVRNGAATDADPDADLPVNLPRPWQPLFPGVTALVGHAGTYAVRRECFAAVGGFAEDLPAQQHTELWLRLMPSLLAGGGTTAHIDEPLMTYTQGSAGNIRGNDLAVARGTAMTLERHRALFATAPDLLATYERVAGVRLARAGDLRQARSYLLRSAWRERRDVRAWGRVLAATCTWTARLAWHPSAAGARLDV